MDQTSFVPRPTKKNGLKLSISSVPHRDENGQLRPYSLELGRLIKKKLWERLNRPTMIMSIDEDGRLHVDVSYGAEECPPEFNVDTTKEPEC